MPPSAPNTENPDSSENAQETSSNNTETTTTPAPETPASVTAEPSKPQENTISPEITPPLPVQSVTTMIQPDHETAYNALENMFETEKISGAQAAELRAIYGRMAADLDARKNYEKELINKARDLSDSLDQQKVQLNKCDEDLEQPSVKPAGKTANDAKVNEVITLRNQLMKCMNEISMLEEKSQENTYQLEVLTEHRRLMSLEKDRQPDPEKMMEQSLDLKRTNELDDKALKIMASTIKQTLEHNETLEKEIDEIKAKLEKAIEDQDHVTAELVANSTVDGMHPAELARCIDKLGKTQESLGLQVETENLKLNEVNVHLGEKMHEYGILKGESQGVKRNYDDSENKNQNKEREFALVNSDFNKEKERESELLHMKDDLEIRQRLLDQERNHVHDQVSRKRREFDRESKSLKKKMLQSQQLTDAKSQLEKLCANANLELLNFPKDEQGEKERRGLDIEVKGLSKRKESEEMNVRVERDAWDQILENIGKLSKEQEQARTLVYEQGRMHHLKSDEREQKSRDVQRAKNRLKQVEREEKAKDLELKNHKKRSSELGQEQDVSPKGTNKLKTKKINT